jgi:hypothetical protein
VSGFELPVIRPDAAPEFTDSAGCAKWVKALPLINIAPSHVRLFDQLDQLNACKLAPPERLKILEILREPVSFVQKEQSKKFSNRPAPLAKTEREVFRSVNALWSALSLGYQHCLQAIIEGANSLNGQTALICQRVLWCTGQKMVDHYQAYQNVAEDDWRVLHHVYALAEERGAVDDPVGHPLHKDKTKTTCTETYAQVLLLHLANPGKLTPRQIELIMQWLESWTPKVSIGPEPPPSAEGVAPLVVDLSHAAGATHRPAEGEDVRHIEIREVGRSVRKRVGLLRKGQTPAALGLGEDVTASLAESLLVMLYRRWCEDKESRAHPRRSTSGTAQVCSGMAAIHYFVTGQAFRGAPRELTKTQHEEIATFGRVATRHEELAAAPPTFPLETWQIKDESAPGLRLQRIDPAANSRLILDQLLGVRPADAKGFLLCTVRWISVSEDFDLRVGVQILPGVPLGIAIRPDMAASEQYTPAFMLPSVAALQAPESLVLPLGWFKPDRVIEVQREGALRVQLVSVLNRGADFERVSFKTA